MYGGSSLSSINSSRTADEESGRVDDVAYGSPRAARALRESTRLSTCKKLVSNVSFQKFMGVFVVLFCLVVLIVEVNKFEVAAQHTTSESKTLRLSVNVVEQTLLQHSKQQPTNQPTNNRFAWLKALVAHRGGLTLLCVAKPTRCSRSDRPNGTENRKAARASTHGTWPHGFEGLCRHPHTLSCSFCSAHNSPLMMQTSLITCSCRRPLHIGSTLSMPQAGGALGHTLGSRHRQGHKRCT